MVGVERQASFRTPANRSKMQALPAQCPLCQSAIVVTRFRCTACDTHVEGQFEPSVAAFAALSPEQLRFVEMFVKCEGRLNRMEAELDLSYPTIRTRLNEIIRRMGYEPGKDEPEPKRKTMSEQDRKSILDDIDAGKLSLDEALKRLGGSEA
jgi:hypothetical protein